MLHQVPIRIELENGGSRYTALTGRRILCRADLRPRIEAVGEVHYEYVVTRINRHADRRTEDPMIRQWLRPHRVHFELGRLAGLGLQAHCAELRQKGSPENDSLRWPH